MAGINLEMRDGDESFGLDVDGGGGHCRAAPRGNGGGFRLTIAILVLEDPWWSARGRELKGTMAFLTYKQGESLLELRHLFLGKRVGLVDERIELAKK